MLLQNTSNLQLLPLADFFLLFFNNNPLFSLLLRIFLLPLKYLSIQAARLTFTLENLNFHPLQPLLSPTFLTHLYLLTNGFPRLTKLSCISIQHLLTISPYFLEINLKLQSHGGTLDFLCKSRRKY